MDRFGEWRPIEAAASDDGEEKSPSKDLPAKPAEPARPEANASSVRLVGLAAAGFLAVAGVFVWMTPAPQAPAAQIEGGAYFDPLATESPIAADSAMDGVAGTELVVDVEGAVVRPGIQRLAGGSRVGDANAAAGGYAPTVDVGAAAAQLNLAAPLTDGDKVHVPARGEAVAAAASVVPRGPSAAGPVGDTGGLININTASSDQLDTLPGIGPVTAAKIIAAREEAPFASVDELLSREIVGSSTFDKLKTLVTIAP
jgi:competence protein ComEA